MQLVITGAHPPDLYWLAQHLGPLLPAWTVTCLEPQALRTWLAQTSRPLHSRVLLCGLDAAWKNNTAAPTTPLAPNRTELMAQDTALRAALAQAGLAFGVVYGQGLQRLQNAQRLVQPQDLPQRAAWACEACSDPDCELKLFTGLKGLKAADPAAP